MKRIFLFLVTNLAVVLAGGVLGDGHLPDRRLVVHEVGEVLLAIDAKEFKFQRSQVGHIGRHRGAEPMAGIDQGANSFCRDRDEHVLIGPPRHEAGAGVKREGIEIERT